MSKKILFINPRENFGSHPEPYPSGAFILMGTMAYNLGHNVRIIHMAIDNKQAEDIKKTVQDFKPDIVGITINTFQTKSSKEITRAVKEADKNILLVAGGPHVSGRGSAIFEGFPDIDAAIFGEGEHSFMEIVEGKELAKIKGIAYKDKENKININPPRTPAENLDYIPLPNLDLAEFNKKNFKGIEPVIALPSMYIMASRGCPFQCIYCNKSIWGFKTRFRKPELIVREIEWLNFRYGVKEIYFQDDTLNLNRQWLETLLKLIIQKGLNRTIAYKVALRANKQLVDEQILKLLKRAGVQYAFYGVENGNQEMLNRMKKGLTIEELKRAFELTHKAGIKTIASFMIGLPGENKQTIEDTVKLWQELKPHLAGYSLATPLPDTEFEKMLLEKGHLLDRNYDHYNFGVGVVRTDELTKEELEKERLRVATKMEIGGLKQKLKNISSNKKDIKELLIKVVKNPKKAIKRLWTIR